MITIHHEKETDFSKNGYGAIDNYVMNQEVFWEMNGQFYAYLEYPAFLDKAEYLMNKNILRIPVPFMDDQLFRIYRTRKVLGFIQVEARHIFYDLMDNLIEDTNIVGKTGQGAVQQLLGATQYGHRFTGLSDITTTNNARMVRYNPVEALLDDTQANTFVSRWGGEIVRDNFTIRMYQQMGSDKGVHIQHKKDLTGYEATFDESTVTTRIMPIGFDGLKLPEMYVDSPLIDLDNPKIDTIKYDTVKAAIGEYANAEDAVPLEEAYALLRQYAKEEYSVNHVDEPRATVKVDFVNLHNTKEYEGFESLQAIHQGDTVKISVIDEGFEITSRLVAFKSDPLQKDHYTSTTLGNHVYAFTSSVNSTTQLRNDVEQLKEDVIMAMQSASGKNRNFWGSADPNTLNLNADVGDNYFRANGEETMLYQYVEINGEKYWKQILDTAQLATIQAEVEKAQATANQAKLDASGAYTNAVAEAERLVSASDEVWQGKMTEFDEQVGLIEVSVQSAQTKADNALREVGISTDLAQTAKGLADTAKANADQAILVSQEAQTKANQISNQFTNWKTSELPTIVSNASNALSLAQTNNGLFYDKKLIDSETGERLVITYADAEQNYVSNANYNRDQAGISAELSRVEGVALASGANINLLVISSSVKKSYLLGIESYPSPTMNQPGFDTSTVLIPFKTGESLTFSKVDVDNGHLQYWRVTFLNTDHTYRTRHATVDNEWTYTADFDGYAWVSYPQESFPKVERGTVKSQYTLAPQDQVNQSNITYLESRIEATAESITTELTRVEKTIPSIAGLATESYVGTKVTQEAGKITTELTNLVNQKASPTDVLNAIANDKSIKDTRNDNQPPSWYRTNYPNQSVEEFKLLSVMGVENSLSEYGILKTVVPRFAKTGGTIQQTLTTDDKVYIRRSWLSDNGWFNWYESATQQFVNTTITQEAGRVEQLITNVKTNPEDTITGYNQLVNTHNSMQQAIGTNGEKITQMVMTDSIFQTSVMNNLSGGGVNLLNRHGEQVGKWVGGSGEIMDAPAPSTLAIRIDVSAIQGKELVFSQYRVNVNADNFFRYAFLNASLVTISRSANNGIEFVEKVPSGAIYLRVSYNGDNKVKIEQGNKKTPWSLAPAESATQSQITQLAESISLRVTKSDLISQINIQAGHVLLQSGTNKLFVTPNTTYIENGTVKSAHIDTLNANKITGNTADFNTIRTGVLTANAVTSTHIKADTALIDTIFSTTALIERLTSKTAFISSIKAMEIDAGKITTGELNAANVRIVNLDVNQLTGNAMNFISGAFTSNAGALSLSGSGMRVNFNNGYSLRINGAGTNYYTSGGQVIGGLLTTIPSAGATHSLTLAARRGYTVSLGYQGSLSYNQSNRALSVDGTSGNITIERPIYESSGSAGLSFLRSEMGNVGWGLLLRPTKATGSGIFLADNGEVWVGVSGGFKQFT